MVFRDRADSWEMGTGAHTGAQIFHPTPPTPKTNRDSSAAIIPTAVGVGRDECWCRGVNGGGCGGNRNTPNLKHPQDGQQCGKHANRNIDRFV